MPTKAEGIGERPIYIRLSSLVGHVVEITFEVGMGEIYRWGNDTVLNGKDAYRCLDGSGGTQKMAHHRLRGANRDAVGVVTEGGL